VDPSSSGEDLFSAYLATFQPDFGQPSDGEGMDLGFVDDDYGGTDGAYDDGDEEYYDAVGPDGDCDEFPAAVTPQLQRTDFRERITSAHTDNQINLN